MTLHSRLVPGHGDRLYLSPLRRWLISGPSGNGVFVILYAVRIFAKRND